jgi:cysteine desulfurase
MIYLDNCATTKLSDNVKQNILNNLNTFGNPSSSYNLGLQSARIIQESREIIAQCINCDPQEIYFTSGASESNTWAFSQFDEVYLPNPIEHHSILNNPRIVDRYNDKCLVSEMWVNNEIGLIQDVKSLKDKYNGAIVHTDATQAIGNIDVKVDDNIDMMSFSGHKLHAPKGIGVLYSKMSMKPLIYGGKQEKGVRGGTENVIGISALGVAIKDAYDNLELKQTHCKKLKQHMIDKLRSYNIDFIENAENMKTIDSCLSLSFHNIESEPMLIQLGLKDIYCSSGSACNSGSLEPSETLKWLNIPKDYINGTLRFSFDLDNTIEEIDFVCDEINKIVNRMKM